MLTPGDWWRRVTLKWTRLSSVTYRERLSGSSQPRMNGRLLRLVSVESEIPETRGRKMTLQQ
jgi:hypothetical protein